MMSCIKLVYNKIIIKWAVKIDQNCLYALFAYISESKARRILLNSVGDADSMGLSKNSVCLNTLLFIIL